MATPRRTPVTAAALVRSQAVVESFTLTPDGRAAVISRRVVQGNAYRSHLYAVSTVGGRARRLTDGPVRDSGPSISPDGRHVAFVRASSRQPGSGGQETSAQAWIMSLRGGRPWQLTRLPHGVTSVRWSPDGHRLALVAEAGEPRFVVPARRRAAEPVARHITRTDWRDDDTGLAGRRRHLWVVDARRGAKPRPLTAGDFDVANPAWSPDGRWIAFDASLDPDWNIRYRYRIFRVPAAGGPMRELVALQGNAGGPAFSPDGRHLAFIGTDVEDPMTPEPVRLWVSSASGRAVRCLTPNLDLSVATVPWADLAMSDDAEAPVWDGNDGLLVMIGRRGRGLPWRVPLDGRAAEPLVDPDARIAGSAVERAGGRTVVSAAVDGRASELQVIDGRRPRRITRLGSAWEDRHRRFTLQELEVTGAAGPIQVWLASPVNAGARPLPTILHFHGGPDGCWAPGGTMDSLLLTAHGYRVAMPNIRGSTTHGRAWIDALQGEWGRADAEDVHSVADALVNWNLADPARMGIMGLSYGGWLVQWMVGVTDRFGAAVAENGVGNVVSDWGEAYFGVHYGRDYGQGDPLTEKGATELWRQSPLRNAARVHTPLLLLQAEEDRNCPPGANEQLFVALKVLGHETEYVLYPEEHHELKNYGRPDRRIDRMERHLAWFDRYLRRRRAAPSVRR